MDEKIENGSGWLSTRHKTRVESKSKPLRYRSSLPKKPRKLGEFVLTQSPPPEQLFKATKQSCLTNFFKQKVKETEAVTNHSEEPALVDVTDIEKNCKLCVNIPVYVAGTDPDAELQTEDAHDLNKAEGIKQSFKQSMKRKTSETAHFDSDIEFVKENRCVSHDLKPEEGISPPLKNSKRRKLSEIIKYVDNEKKLITKCGIEVAVRVSDEEYSSIKDSRRIKKRSFENSWKTSHSRSDEDDLEIIRKRSNTQDLIKQFIDDDIPDSVIDTVNKSKIDNLASEIGNEGLNTQTITNYSDEQENVETVEVKQFSSLSMYKSLTLENQRDEKDCDSFELECQIPEDSMHIEGQTFEKKFGGSKLESQKPGKNCGLHFESINYEKEYKRLQCENLKTEKEYDSLQLNTQQDIQKDNQKYKGFQFETQYVNKGHDSLQLNTQQDNLKDNQKYKDFQFETQYVNKGHDSLQLDTQQDNLKDSQKYKNFQFETQDFSRDYDSLQLQSQFTFQSQREYYDALERDLALGKDSQ